MDITIRAAVQSDREKIRPLQQEIADLHREGRPDLFKTGARRISEEDFSQRLENPDHTILIAENENSEVVGYAFAWVIHYRNHPTYIDFDSYYIDDICVLGSHRRMGIGKRLFEHCKAIACEKHCKNIDLGVWGFNREAIAFYESCGMTERVRRMEYRLEG